MTLRRLSYSLALAALLAGCGGGNGSVSAPPTGSNPGTSTPTPTPTTAAGCSLRERQTWVAQQLNEWYLFPETLPASLDPAPYASVQDYLDGLTATARAQSKDRYFTYITSIAEENAYYSSGSSAGLGIRLGADYTAHRLFVIEAFETGPASAAGIKRGTEIVAIGTSASNLRTVDAIWTAGGVGAVSDALGPDDNGVTRVLRITDAAGTRDVTVTKRDFELQPLSSAYGYKILDDGGRKVGYLNLRTFISTADPQLRTAFAAFRAAGVTELVIDLRYNGGGLISIAELMGDLLGANRSASEVFAYTVFRASKASNNTVGYFAAQPQSIAPTKIAFIGTGSTASASEMVINAMLPYLGANAGLIGTNTYGKPVGQIALDRAQCDDRLRVIALAVQNSQHRGDYYTGLAGTVQASCQADDDISYEMGDPREHSTRAALDYLAGRSCASITASANARTTLSARANTRELLTPARPSTPQREVPGLF